MCAKNENEKRIEEAMKKMPAVFLGHSDELTKIFNNALEDADAQPKWNCTLCGGDDVQILKEAWFNPNKNFEFIEEVMSSDKYAWCNDCNDKRDIKEGKKCNN